MTQPPLGPTQNPHDDGPLSQGQPWGPPQPMPGYGPPPSGQPTQAFSAPMAPPPVGQEMPTAPRQSKSKRRWPWTVAAVVVAFGVGTAAGGGTDEPTTEVEAAPTAAPVTTTVVVTQPAPAATPTQPAPVPVQAAPTTSAAATPVVDFAMPAVVGLDLQTAQNTLQLNGLFFSVSHDLRGSRMQAVDSNWIVCTQNVAPGERVTGNVEGLIDFGVVKREESCP